MKEMTFKSFVRNGNKTIQLIEAECIDGKLRIVDKKSRYFLKRVVNMNSKDDLQTYVNQKKRCPGKKSFHTLRGVSNGMELVRCKMLGELSAVIGEKIYEVVFVHSIRFLTEIKTNKQEEIVGGKHGSNC